MKIGHKVQPFKATSVLDNEIKHISLDDFPDKYKVIFFYPLDFTFVCPTEIHAFQDSLNEFKSRNCEVIGASVDSAYSHLAWLKTPKSKGGIEGINFHLISDINKKLSNDFGVLDEEKGVALRGLFILDKNNVIQHASINNLGLGRNIDEVLRLLDALCHHEKYGEVCPANWTVGKKAMKATEKGLEEYFNQ